MWEQRVAEHSVLMDVDEASAGPRRPKRPVEKTFRRYDQGQPMLLAPDIRDWLAAEHPARWVDALVEEGLDLSPIYDDYTEVRGGPPYDPRLMVKVLILRLLPWDHLVAGVGAALPRRRRLRVLDCAAGPGLCGDQPVPDPARRGV